MEITPFTIKLFLITLIPAIYYLFSSFLSEDYEEVTKYTLKGLKYIGIVMIMWTLIIFIGLIE